MLSFFPRGVLDEILNLIESVSEGFPSYSNNDTIYKFDNKLNKTGTMAYHERQNKNAAIFHFHLIAKI